MSNSILEGLIKEKDYTFKKLLFKLIKDFDLTLEELLLLIYFINQDKPVFDIKKISIITYLDNNEIMSAFSSLTAKGLVSIKTSKEDGKITEIIDITNTYRAMVSDINVNIKKQTVTNIYTIFEKEFGRPLSPVEYEIIKAWITSGISEELIKGALKEAVFNNVRNLRYIDKILSEWEKKGFKSVDEVDSYLKKKEVNNPKQELFDYNWLEDEE
ncbi:dNA replication protein DnaD [Clostridium sp. CAG:533]|jgi:DNA replication protein|nr:MAG: DnaD domain protein [Clostridiaceae bacterium]CDA52514.1 dNA replication protein DnaD [Clostridium sp. CAG:533]